MKLRVSTTSKESTTVERTQTIDNIEKTTRELEAVRQVTIKKNHTLK